MSDDTTPTAGRTPPSHRLRPVATALLGSLFALLVIGTATAGSVTADAPDGIGVVSGPAERAVADLVGPRPLDALTHLPPGFSSRFGYRPVVQDGRPVNPHGSCSSPIPLPDRFEPFCRAHDFGYDLLRLAEADGTPAAPWARHALDAMLVRAMHDSCTNPLCEMSADLADAGLSMNSWRQEWRAPTRESTAETVSSAVLRTVGAFGAR